MTNSTSSKNGDAQPDMGKVYDDHAEAFRQADQLTTWRFVVKPALERMLAPVLHAGKKFLDLGSASARVEVGVLLPGGVQAGDITGVEISPKEVEMAKLRVPEATFLVGNVADPALLPDKDGTFDAVFSSMVFEHLSDEQLEQACKNARRLLKPDGLYVFVVTHPDKMTDLSGNLLTEYGPFETSAPWGGVVHNWRRSVEDTLSAVRNSGFEVTLTEELPYPSKAPTGLSEADSALFQKDAEHYRRYPAIRLAVQAKPRP